MVGRKCGKLFCETHTMYQMKLSMSAQWEPVRYPPKTGWS
jgi:rabenosyn-5